MLFVAAVLIGSIPYIVQPLQAMEKPNIIFIFPDQLRKDAVGCYGEAQISTPAIDKLAGQGLVFDNAISTVPVCGPYRGMLMTGRYPTHSGMINNFLEISPQQNPNSIAVTLKRAGYDTALIGKWHLASFGQGEHSSFVPPGPKRLGFDHWEAYNFHASYNDYWYYKDEPVKIFDDRYETDAIFGQAIELLESRQSSDKPLFMVLTPHPPHPPFDAIKDAPSGYLDQVPSSLDWSPNVDPESNPRLLEEMRVYLAMVRNFDYNLGLLLDYLERSGQENNTLIILTTDHGEMHGSHGRINKMVAFEESINIPLIMRWPEKIRPGRRSNFLVSPMDFLPTLASLTGTEIPPEIDGTDLCPYILDESAPSPDRDLLIMNYSSHWNLLRSDTPDTAKDWRCWPEWRGVRNKRYTYVLWLNGDEELYDNKLDPFQQQNIVNLDSDHTKTLVYHRNALKRLLEEAHDEFLPGTAYNDWFNKKRELLRTALGPVPTH